MHKTKNSGLKNCKTKGIKKKETSFIFYNFVDIIFFKIEFKLATQCLKITQNVAFEFWHLAFSTNFCPIKIDLSGNTV